MGDTAEPGVIYGKMQSITPLAPPASMIMSWVRVRVRVPVE